VEGREELLSLCWVRLYYGLRASISSCAVFMLYNEQYYEHGDDAMVNNISCNNLPVRQAGPLLNGWSSAHGRVRGMYYRPCYSDS